MPCFLKSALFHPNEFDEFINFLATRGEDFGSDFQGILDDALFDPDNLPPAFLKQLESTELEATEFITASDVVTFMQNVTWSGRDHWSISESRQEIVVPTKFLKFLDTNILIFFSERMEMFEIIHDVDISDVVFLLFPLPILEYSPSPL